MLVKKLKPCRFEQVNNFVAVARRCKNFSKRGDIFGHRTRLLLKLADAAVYRLAIAFIQLARGYFQQSLFKRITVLAHQKQLIIISYCKHTYAAGMVHNLPASCIAVGQADSVIYQF